MQLGETRANMTQEETTKKDNSVNTAPIKWAQREDFLYITVVVDEVTDESVTFTETSMNFKGKDKKGRYYEHDIEFYQPINPDGSAFKVHPLGVQVIVKKDKENRNDGEDGFWPRLLKEVHHGLDVTVDWNRWIDEDDDQGEDNNLFSWNI
jgi:cytosolic prostaglandin-E synthase